MTEQQDVVDQVMETEDGNESGSMKENKGESKKKPNNDTSCSTKFTFQEYKRNNIVMKNYKLTELKQMAKYNKLPQTGTKQKLIQKLHTFFASHNAAVMIQKRIRGRFVRMVLNVEHRGPAFHNRKICVNETDFYTMEPLIEIPFQQFFSFTDEHTFTYGFDIHSLVILYRKKQKLINPYNREEFVENLYTKIFEIYRLIRIVFPNHVIEDDIYVSPFQRTHRRRQQRTRAILPNTLNENTMVAVHDDRPQLPTRFSMNRYQTTSVAYIAAGLQPLFMVQFLMQMETKYQSLAILRQKPTITRIQELFMEMDQLGNYTDASWMLELSITNLHAFYRYLIEIWRFRAQIPYEVKHHICPIEDPFTSIGPGNDQNIDFMYRVCLGAMENMVFTGFDVEYRKLGAMHVLTALTMVSTPARNTFFWLYETMV